MREVPNPFDECANFRDAIVVNLWMRRAVIETFIYKIVISILYW